MDWTVLATCVLIILARITDVSLGTIRTVCVVTGRRWLAWGLGFFEVLIWVTVVSRVIDNLNQPAYAVSYALGFATGNYVGMAIESWLALGQQVVRVFTRQGDYVAEQLRQAGYRVTRFDGRGRDGPVALLYTEIPRRRLRAALDHVHELDPHCYYTVDDIRVASSALLRQQQGSTGWASILKRK